MKVLHERETGLFWITGFSLADKPKMKEMRSWLKDNQIEYQYYDCIGDWERLMILDPAQAVQYKLLWGTGELF